MTETCSIRIASIDDIHTIGFLAQQIWPDAYGQILSKSQLDYMLNLIYSPAAIRNQLTEQNHQFLIVENNAGPVGFASYSFISPPGIFKLHKLYVSSQLQGKGLGKLLLDYIVQDIRSAGATNLRLNVNRHNKAKNFYEKLGFKVIAEEDIDIGNNFFMNDFIMDLPITGS